MKKIFRSFLFAYLSLAICSCFSWRAFAQVQEAWAVPLPPSGTNRFMSLAGPDVFFVSDGASVVAVLYGPDGSTVWSETIAAAPSGSVRAVAADSSGNPFISGSFGTMKLSATDGRRLWSAPAGGMLALDSAGDAYASATFGTTNLAANNGAQIWSAPIGGQIVADKNNNACVSNGSQVAKVSAIDGSVLWSVPYRMGGGLAVDGNGNVIISDVSSTIPTNAIVKLSTVDGSQLWIATPGPGFTGVPLAVDSAGNVYSRGNAYINNVWTGVTVSFAAADGTELWMAPVTGVSLAADNAGDLYVSGPSSGTTKLTGGAGSPIWAVASGSLSSGLLAVDSVGDVYVADQNYLLKKFVQTGISTLSPNTAVSGSASLTLTVNGFGFASGSVVLWNGAPLTTTFVNSGQLTAQIPSTDLTLSTSVNFATVPVTVQNPNGTASSPATFTVTANNVTSAQSTSVGAGETSTVSTAPTASDGSGVTATASGNPTALTITAANYSGNPTSGTYFDAGGGYVDLQVTGANSSDSVTAYFYYPSTITGSAETSLQLTYYTGSGWAPVLSSGGLAPAKETTDNLDGTVSGGRFTVVFDNTSTPPITGLTGTVFGSADSSKPLVSQVSGPSGLIAAGAPVNLAIQFSAAGAPSSQLVVVTWGDGMIDDLVPTQAGSITATHAYQIAGIFSPTVAVWDGNNNQASSVFGPLFVYAPGAGSITGGGWFASPAGAFTSDPTLASEATFGFNAKYLGASKLLRGQFEFQLHGAGLNFHASDFQLLALIGNRAWLEGTGAINQQGNYQFLVSAQEADAPGGPGAALRIKIWDSSSSAVVYDNQPGASETADLKIPMGGGGIKVSH